MTAASGRLVAAARPAARTVPRTKRAIEKQFASANRIPDWRRATASGYPAAATVARTLAIGTA